MTNFVQAFKDEIRRLARKEARIALSRVRRNSVRVRKAAAELKRRVSALERANKLLSRELVRCSSGSSAVQAPVEAKGRITAKGVRSLRRKLGLTRDEFARLLETTSQSVYLWEKKNGALSLRQGTGARYLALRGIGAREARQRLAEMKPVRRKAAAKRGRNKRRSGKK